MIQNTSRTIRKSTKLLLRTRELLKQSEALTIARIRIPDTCIDQHTR